MSKKRVGRHPREFKQKAVERLKSCEHVGKLAEELDVHRRLLYRWREQLEPSEGETPAESSPEKGLRIQLAQAQRLLAEKTLEVDFFRGALQKVKAQRQRSTPVGETASTPRSGSR